MAEKIQNCVQLIKEWVGYNPERKSPFKGAPCEEERITSNKRAEMLVRKWCFKYTDCGCCFSVDSEGIIVAGYAEGSDAELPRHSLKWGFAISEFEKALAQADEEGVEEWKACNGEVDDD